MEMTSDSDSDISFHNNNHVGFFPTNTSVSRVFHTPPPSISTQIQPQIQPQIQIHSPNRSHPLLAMRQESSFLLDNNKKLDFPVSPIQPELVNKRIQQLKDESFLPGSIVLSESFDNGNSNVSIVKNNQKMLDFSDIIAPDEKNNNNNIVSNERKHNIVVSVPQNMSNNNNNYTLNSNQSNVYRRMEHAKEVLDSLVVKGIDMEVIGKKPKKKEGKGLRFSRVSRILPETNSLRDMKNSIKRYQEIDNEDMEDVVKREEETNFFSRTGPGINKHKSQGKLRSRMELFERWSHDLRNWWQRRQYRSDDFALFRSSLKHISAYFGSGVASVFEFMRWIILLNLLLFVTWAAFVIIPFIVKRGFTTGIDSSQLKWYTAIGFVGLENTFAFFGGYQTNQAAPYFFAIICMYVLGFAALFRKMAYRLKQRFDRASLVRKDRFYPFTSIIFASWDHTITNKETADNLRKGISTTLQEILGDIGARDVSKAARKNWKIRLFGRIVGIVLTLLLLAAVFVVISIMVINEATITSKTTVYIIPIAVSVFNLVLPFVVRFIVTLEKWNPRIQVQQIIMRVFLLKVFTLLILMVRIYVQVSGAGASSIPLLGKQLAATATENVECPETAIGRQVLRLVISDMIISALGTLLWGLVGRLVFTHSFEFDIPQTVLDMIHRQSLVWIGSPFCPVLPLVGLLSSLFIFFINKWVSLWACTPPVHPWGANRISNYFLVFLSVSLLVTSAPVILFFRIQESVCGPFEGYVAWNLISEKIYASSFSSAFKIITSPIILGLLVIVLLIMLFFNSAFLTKQKIMLEESLMELDREHLEKISLIRSYVAQAQHDMTKSI